MLFSLIIYDNSDMKLKIYRYAIIVISALLILLNIYFIVRTIMQMIGQEGLQDYKDWRPGVDG